MAPRHSLVVSLPGTLVGLLHNDLPVAGLVDLPVLDECYIGLNGFGRRLQRN